MTPPPTNPNMGDSSLSLLQQALDFANLSCNICDRLSNNFVKNHPATPNEPLTSLVQKHIKALIIDIQDLRSDILVLVAKEQQGETDSCPTSPVISTTRLAEVKIRLFETLELLEFYKDCEHERVGPEGALNALFATTHILNGPGALRGGRIHYNQERLLPLGLEFVDLISDLGRETSLQWDPVAVFQAFQSRIHDFLQKVSSTLKLRPRHLRAFEYLNNTPYTIDSAAETFSGSYGMVQKVHHKQTGECFAMKTFTHVFSERDKSKVLRELGVLEICHHKNIVELVDALSLDEDQSIRLVISPWAPCSLSLFLRMWDPKRKKTCPWFELGKPESIRCVYRIMYELADGVAYLHERSIKHKDIKPDNILLYNEDCLDVTPLITDVGVSKIYTPGGKTNFKDSTYQYLALEQHQMESSTLACDIWQLGCCFAELLAVCSGGTTAYNRLVDSYMRDDPNCACSIALEHGPFVRALHSICVKDSIGMSKAYPIVMAMLSLDPADRPDIKFVKAHFKRLVSI